MRKRPGGCGGPRFTAARVRVHATPLIPLTIFFFFYIGKIVNKTVFICILKKIKIFLYIFIEKKCTILYDML